MIDIFLLQSYRGSDIKKQAIRFNRGKNLEKDGKRQETVKVTFLIRQNLFQKAKKKILLNPMGTLSH